MTERICPGCKQSLRHARYWRESYYPRHQARLIERVLTRRKEATRV